MFIYKLGIKIPSMKSKITKLSGGNKQKVIIAQCLNAKCDVYLFDEPTRGVDTAGKVEIYNIINELINKGAAIIIVSSDFSELIGMCILF